MANDIEFADNWHNAYGNIAVEDIDLDGLEDWLLSTYVDKFEEAFHFLATDILTVEQIEGYQVTIRNVINDAIQVTRAAHQTDE
jgi:hypothetical protein